MATTEPQTPAAPSADSPPARGAAKLLLALGLGGTLVGGAAGFLVLGPRLAHREPAPQAAHPAAAADTKPGKIFRLENLILNPAGSDGGRFLMISVAFEIGDEQGDVLLREREIQLRDAAMAVLEKQPLATLTQPGARDRLKGLLGQVATPFLPPGTKVKVYLPQFVIQ